MLRKSPLKPGKALLRRTPLAQVGARRLAAAKTAGKRVKATLKTTVKPAVPPRVVKRLAKRSGGVCEMQLIGCTWWATDPCHRIKRGDGGRHGAAEVESYRLSNLVHGCRSCHQWTHSHSTEAYDEHLRLKEGQVPPDEPLPYRGSLAFLADDGRVIPFEEAAA